jgi:hypothetical protein
MMDSAFYIANAATPTLEKALAKLFDFAAYSANARAELEQARRDHELARLSNGSDPLIATQDRLLSLIVAARNEIILEVSDIAFLQKCLALLTEQMRETYKATEQWQLAFVEGNVAQIKAAVQTYRRNKLSRYRIRVAAVAVSVLGIIALGVFLSWAPGSGITSDSRIPLLELPVPVLLWSVIGSFAAILYRFSTNGDAEIADPLRWLFSRPLTGIVIGSITYLIIRVGVVTLTPAAGAPASGAASLGSNELIWLIAFLAGFSDKFADRLLSSSVGRFGGDQGDLVSVPAAIGSRVDTWINPALLSSIGGMTETRTTIEQTATSVSADTRVNLVAGAHPQHTGSTAAFHQSTRTPVSDYEAQVAQAAPLTAGPSGEGEPLRRPTQSVSGYRIRERLRALAAASRHHSQPPEPDPKEVRAEEREPGTESDAKLAS